MSTEPPFSSKGSYDVFFMNTNSQGDVLSTNTFGRAYYDIIYETIITKNNTVFLAGHSNTASSGDGLILKYTPKADKDIQVIGDIQPTLASISVPSEPLSFVINPNLEEDKQFISPSLTIQNETNAPLKLSVNSLTQTLNTLTDVMPDYFDSWDGLSLTESKFIALSLRSLSTENWINQDNSEIYVADSEDKSLGTIKPNSDVDLSFNALHGQSFKESLTLQYKLTLIFDLSEN